MSDYYQCPNCGHKPNAWGASHMEIYACNDCGKEFCHRCPGSNGARECPRCRSRNFRTTGKSYAK